MSGSAKERFEEIRDRYDGIYDQIVAFHNSLPPGEHRECMGDFIHETSGMAGKVGRALLRGEMPEHRPSYYNLRAHAGVMELILALASACVPDGTSSQVLPSPSQ